MIRTSTLLALVAFVSSLLSSKTVSAVNYVDNGTSTSYNLNNNDSLYIASGRFTGSINNWMGAPKITISASATFNPSSFGYFLGSIINNGTATLPRIDGQTSNFRFTNYGRLTVTGTTYIYLGRFTNMFGATATFNNTFTANTGTILNNGTMLLSAKYYNGASSTFTNNNTLSVTGDLEINGSTLNNNGKLSSTGLMTLSSATVASTCKIWSEGTINISSSTIANYGLIWASAERNNSKITVGGTITCYPGSWMKAVDFKNDGNIVGTGNLYFTGNTDLTGRIGRNGNTSDSIKVYDATRTSPSRIFDAQSGTVYNNVVFAQLDQPDTAGIYSSCATEAVSVPLAVKYNYFYVTLSNNTPALSWSADTDEGGNFEVQRSYDGITFNQIGYVAAKIGVSTYAYNDNNVNTQSKTVYYRIRAIEPTGAVKVSDVRSVRFSNSQNISVQTAPNPFTSQFNIGFQSTTRETIQMKMVNVTGQVLSNRVVTISNGYNNISITEAANFQPGVYMVQLVGQQGVIAVEKVVKK